MSLTNPTSPKVEVERSHDGGVFRDGLAAFASGPPVQAGIAAIFGKETLGKGDRRWQESDYGTYTVATFLYSANRNGGTVLVQPVEPYGAPDGERMGGELGWALVRDVGIRTAWIHLILAAYAAASERANPTVDRFIVTAGKLADYLGYTGRGRGRKHRPLQDILAEMEEEMRLASAWGITLKQVHAYRDEQRQGKTKRIPFIIRELEDRLWDIAVVREYQGRLDDPQGRGELRNIAWTVRPGQWAAYFLSSQGMRQWGLLAQAVLSIDAYHQPMAAKMAVYLQLQSRIRLAKGQPLVYTVRQLLEAIHEFPEPQPQQSSNAIRQARHRKRLQLHKAVENVLPTSGIIEGGPQGRGYEWLTPGLRPGESYILLTWEEWLAARVQFHLPEAQVRGLWELADTRRKSLKRGARKGGG